MSDSSEPEIPPSKKCRDCGQVKAAREFWKNKKSPDGLAYYCKECFGLRNADTYRKRLDRQGKQPVREYRRVGRESAGTKYCPKCKEVKPVEEFGKNRAEKTGLTAYCKLCHNAAGRETKQRLYGGTRYYHIQHRYGITAAEVDEMIARQGGRCMICRVGKAEHVDHDHKTGEVRGILCFNCNGGLGQFKDRRDTMARAIGYLLGTLPPLPVEEMLDDRWNVVLTVLDDDTDIRLSADYAHA